MAAINAVTDLTVEDGIAVLTLNSPPVNALSASVRDGIAAALTQINQDAAIKAAVIMCAGRTFIAGADISEFGKPPQGADLLDVLGGD
jgi:3-hydroxyacyl-CoA dehydrogenase